MGFYIDYAEIEEAIDNATSYGRSNNGAIVVAAIGNDNTNDLQYPAAYPKTIAVGGTDRNDQRSSFSNYGNGLDIVAPATSVPTLAYNTNQNIPADNYTIFNGTSIATSQVSGIISLILSMDNDFTYLEVADILRRSAQKVGGYIYTPGQGHDPNLSWNNQMGFGRVDACMALIESFKMKSDVTGPDRICTTNTNFTLQNVPAGQTVTWAVSPTYLFPSTGRTGTGTTATLRAAGTSVSGAATLTYTVDTDCGEYEVSREIWVGVPNTSMQVDANYYPICLNEYTYINAFYDPYNSNPAGNKDADITNFIWQQPAGVSYFTSGTRNEVLACLFTTPNMYTVRVRAVNSCGQGAFQNVYFNVYGCTYYSMSLNPNPANGRVRIALTEMPLDESAKVILQSENKDTREYQEYSFDSPPQRIRVFDLTGAERICVEDPPSDSSYELDISHLRPGVYVVHLDHRNGTVTRQLRVE